ncbi:MAG: DUF1549 domain-containing protein [Pirellulales bacterium]|nr:DUF1549 domain-containing protein [Pirellulales bacterium]
MFRLATVFALGILSISGEILAGDSVPVSFYRQVRPILQARCQGCHQPAKAGGGYVMMSVEAMLRQGDSDLVGVVPGDPAASHLIAQITPEDGTAAMPQEGDPLTEAQIALIARWIGEGADDDTPAGARPVYDNEHPPTYSRPPVVPALDFSPNGALIAVGAFHEVVLHDAGLLDASQEARSVAVDAQPLARLIGLSERIASVKFSPDGTKLAVTGGSPARMGEVQVWDVASRELELSLPVTFDTVYGASWSPDGKRLAFGCADNTVRAIDAATGEQVLFQGAHSDWVLDTVFSADGTHLASVGRDATVKLIEVDTERFVDNITSITPGALRGGINAVARHPDRDEILFGGADGVPKIYRMHRTTKRVIGDDANQLWVLPPLPGRVFSVDYSADGRLIAAGSSLDGVGTVHLYNIDPNVEIPEDVSAILIKPTHSRTPEEVQKLEQHFADGIRQVAALPFDDGGIYAVAISADGSRVAAAGASGKVRMIDGASGAVVHEFVPVEVVPQKEEVRIDVAAAKDRSRPLPVLDGNESLPADAEVMSLSIQPTSFQLHSSTDYVQLVVTAELAGGDRVDVTRLAKLEAGSAAVSVSPTGIVRGAADGSTTISASLEGKTGQSAAEVKGISALLQPDYILDVSPILARAGCNAGTCHGAQDGKNGFKLSLRGYDPLFDVRSLADDLASRRTDLASPAQSLMLLKPTASVPHEGGRVLQPEGDYYRTLLAWVEGGAKLATDAPRVTQIDVTPVNPIVQRIGSRQQMRVVATYADGQQRDVTREAFVESGDTEIAKPVAEVAGLIEVLRRGEAPVLVRYEGAYAATTITVMGDRSGFVWEDPPVHNKIDELVHAKLRRTKTSPAPLCNDYTFLRRVYLDLTGLPPTPEQIVAFRDDPRDSQWKRNQLVDQLIGSTEYIEHWSNKWADLLLVNSKFLGREGAEALRNWIRGEIAANRPYDEFARTVLTASGSTKENPAASYYKILREPDITMENTTQLFLATRFNCNKCHDHPFERWTQDQYYQLSAFFARVGFKKDPAGGDKMVGGTSVDPAKPLYEEVFAKPEGEVTHLRTSKVAAPQFPFDCQHQCADDATRRAKLAAWITSPDNQYFAKSYMNRVWAYLTGRGLIEPIDDIRAGNPPTNPELLDWLTGQFIESGFDVQQQLRTICRSRTYQLSLNSNRFNEDDVLNYSHARARRLPAEVLYDAIYSTTGAKSAFPSVPAGTRAAALPDVGIQLPDGFLNTLGRPARESACECERSSQLQMGPIMALINGASVGQAVSDPEGAIAKLAATTADDRQLLENLFLRILGRPAAEGELTDVLKVVGGIDEQHEQLVKELADYEAKLLPILENREEQRLAALEAARQDLAAYIEAAAPLREQLSQDREDRILAAKKRLKEIRALRVAALPQWEAGRQNDTQWEVLDPIEIRSTSGAALRAQPDRSVYFDGGVMRHSTTYVIAPAKLSGITGVQIEALSDDRLPERGPGLSDDGNFVLTQLKFSAAVPYTQSPPLVRSWEFSADSDGWTGSGGTVLEPEEGYVVAKQVERSPQLFSPVAAPAAPLALEVTAKLSQHTTLSVHWQTESEPTYDRVREASRQVSPGSGDWRTYRIDFHPKSPPLKVRLSFEGGGAEVAIDAVRLLEAKPAKFAPVKLSNAQADFSQTGYPVAAAIDGVAAGRAGWGVSPQSGRDHQAIFETSEDYAATGTGLVALDLVQNFSNGKYLLGRFRISITRSPRPINFGLPMEIVEVLAIAADKRSAEQSAELADYVLSRDDDYADQRFKLYEAERPVPPDAEVVKIENQIAELELPLPSDPEQRRLRRAVELSKQQLLQKRVTAAEDVAWSLINSPEFLYNH